MSDGARHAIVVGTPRSPALACDASGAVATVEAPPLARRPLTPWGVARATRADLDVAHIVVRTLEDTPLYANAWVRTLLPFRMRRG